MNEFASALLPVLVIIVTGYLLNRSGFICREAWSGLEKLTYYLLFPALLISSLGNQSLGGAPWSGILFVVLGTLSLVSLLLVSLLLITRLLVTRLPVSRFISRSTINNARFTSIFQGGVRFNTYITFAVVQDYYGAEGMTLAAITAGFMIVFINLLCIAVFAVWGKSRTTGLSAVLKEIVYNPLIIACLIGWFMSLSGTGLHETANDILQTIGKAALPLGLLAVGAALRPEAIKGHLSDILTASVFQFGLKPTLIIGFIGLFGLQGIVAGVLIIAFMTPTAPSAYILARQLGGDAETMSSIITFQTLLGFILMPLIAFFAHCLAPWLYNVKSVRTVT